MFLRKWGANMKETIKTIMDWHEQTFPDATLNSQLVKYQEEQREWVESGCKDITELADMFIVACGLARFDIHEGLYALSDVYDWYSGEASLDMTNLIAEVEEKMKKNRKRDWAKTAEGTYHHTNEE